LSDEDDPMHQPRITRTLTAVLLWIGLIAPAALAAGAQEATPLATPGAALDVPLIDAS
jgi:hypothetical protein